MEKKNKLSIEESLRKMDGFFTEAGEEIEPDTYKTIDKGVFLPPDQSFYRVNKNDKD